jgi:hypothetical protein
VPATSTSRPWMPVTLPKLREEGTSATADIRDCMSKSI